MSILCLISDYQSANVKLGDVLKDNHLLILKIVNNRKGEISGLINKMKPDDLLDNANIIRYKEKRIAYIVTGWKRTDCGLLDLIGKVSLKNQI